MKRIFFILSLALLLLPFSYYAKAQVLNPPFCVIRVPGVSEAPSSYYGVEYPTAATFSLFGNGFLSIKDSRGVQLAVWAPGQWVRIEKDRCY